MPPADNVETAGGRGAILYAARELEARGIYLFFKHGARFHDPLVPEQWAALRDEPTLDDGGVRRVVLDELTARLPQLARGIYSPVPIAHGLDAGRSIESLLDEFRYEMIHVDVDQRWVWMGRPVAARIKTFFLGHLGWEPAIRRWFFEYRVNPEWWDKSYFDAEVTPLVAIAMSEEDGAMLVTLNSGRERRARPRHAAARPARAALLRQRALRRGAVRRRGALLDPAACQRSLRRGSDRRTLARAALARIEPARYDALPR